MFEPDAVYIVSNDLPPRIDGFRPAGFAARRIDRPDAPFSASADDLGSIAPR